MPIVAVEPIVDDDWVLRRIHPSQIIDDKNAGTKRPSSGAFTDPDLSADSELLLAKFGLDSNHCIKNHAGYSLARVSVQVARTAGMAVTHTPQEDNPAHTDVTGKKTKATQRQLSSSAEWVVIK
jgi:hypothetical protein